MRRARLARIAAAGLLALSSLGIEVGTVVAADPVTFGVPQASSTYGKSIVFEQPVVLAAAPRRVELLTRTPGTSGPSVTEIDTVGSGDRTLRFELDLAKGHIVPNTRFVASWRVTDSNGQVWLGPSATLIYADDSVKWNSLSGDIVRVHWYDGSDAFGRRALAIGEKAVSDTASLLGVTESEPIDFFIYADQDKFYDALGPGTRENVGGQAHADIRTLFALITPAEIDATWVDTVVPHELTHLVFDTAIDNPFHEPPHWLNEGLAVYLSEGYTSSYRAEVEQVAGDGTIIPLEGLAGAFPTTFERFSLAYGESVSAVDHIIKANSRDALVALIRSYATGVTDDEAFKAALGVDTAGFEAQWLADLGAGAPVRFGPQPAPPGPVPDGWSGTAPNPSVGPGTGSTPAPGANRPPTDTTGSDSAAPILVALILAGLIGGGLVLLVASRRARRSTPPVP